MATCDGQGRAITWEATLQKGLQQLAEEKAQKRISRPSYEAGSAGIAGLAIAGGSAAVFMGLAGLDQDDFAFPLLTVAAIGFVGPYLHYRGEWKRYNKVVGEELSALIKGQGH